MKHALLILMLLTIAACGEADPQATELPPTTTDSATVSPALPVEVRLDVEARYESLRQSHEQLSAIWEGLATGEQHPCTTEYEIIAPEMIAGDHALYRTLQQAAIDLEQAAQLWEAECANPRPQVPQSIIDQGMLIVRAAGDSLLLIEQALNGNE